jgi:hypothetical protein
MGFPRLPGVVSAGFCGLLAFCVTRTLLLAFLWRLPCLGRLLYALHQQLALPFKYFLKCVEPIVQKR